MKFNKKILFSLIVGFGLTSQATAKIQRMSGPAIGRAIQIVKQELKSGPKSNTSKAYRTWLDNLIPLIKRLGYSKPQVLTSEAYSKPTLTEWFTQASNAAFNKSTNMTIESEQAEQSLEDLETSLQEASKELAEVTTMPEEITTDIEQKLENTEDLKKGIEIVEESGKIDDRVTKEEQEEEEVENKKEEQEVEQTQSKLRSFFENIKSTFVQDSPKDEFKDSIDAAQNFIKQEIQDAIKNQLKKDTPEIQIDTVSTYLKTLKEDLLGRMNTQSNQNTQAKVEYLKEAHSLFSEGYWKLAQAQSQYAKYIADTYTKKITDLAKKAVYKKRKILSDNVTFENALNKIIDIKIKNKEDIEEILSQIVSSRETLSNLTEDLAKHLGLSSNSTQNYASMKIALDLLKKYPEVIEKGNELKDQYRKTYGVDALQNSFKTAYTTFDDKFFTPSLKAQQKMQKIYDKINKKESSEELILANLKRNIINKMHGKIAVIKESFVKTIDEMNETIPSNIKVELKKKK